MKQLLISKGRHALLDDEDHEKFCSLRWTYVNGYAAKHTNSGYVFMHTFLLGPLPSQYRPDHIDRNKLNNQKKNLRIVTHRANALNNGCQGVFYRRGRYEAQVCRISFGYFDSPEVAKHVAFVAKAHIFYNELLPLRHLNTHLTDEEYYKL